MFLYVTEAPTSLTTAVKDKIQHVTILTVVLLQDHRRHSKRLRIHFYNTFLYFKKYIESKKTNNNIKHNQKFETLQQLSNKFS